MGRRVVIIGAGIVGCATALRLTQEGFEVTVFDPDPPGANTSSGNAGVISTGGITPNATPGLIRDLPRMALDPEASGWVRRGDRLAALPWLWRMLRSSRMGEVRRIAGAMHPLVSQSLDAHRRLAASVGGADLITVGGWMKVYGSAGDFASAALDRELMAEYGVDLRLLDAADLRRHLPAIDGEALHAAVHQPQAGLVSDPQALATAYLNGALDRGARHLRRAVLGAFDDGRHVTVQTVDDEQHFDHLVVCAGARSARIAAWFGDHVLLLAERGYHAQFPPETAGIVPGPIYFASHGLVLSPMAGGLRMTMGAELARPGAPPDFRRLRGKIRIAQNLAPALAGHTPHEWMGERPSTPDTLPVIRHSRQTRRVVYAFGHGHLGLTMAATTAELATGLIG
ncbi:MAG: FAD-binding oxidoreductase [Paracoccus sp. (in: a-proteobacteria)]|nr:FAD-binding oxidoreductase [Paracoccus sp. (in: a-proteobacteria)]